MKIAEVSEQYGLSSDTLRYYERVGLIPPAHRNESGIRVYSELDLRRVEFIKYSPERLPVFGRVSPYFFPKAERLR